MRCVPSDDSAHAARRPRPDASGSTALAEAASHCTRTFGVSLGRRSIPRRHAAVPTRAGGPRECCVPRRDARDAHGRLPGVVRVPRRRALCRALRLAAAIFDQPYREHPVHLRSTPRTHLQILQLPSSRPPRRRCGRVLASSGAPRRRLARSTCDPACSAPSMLRTYSRLPSIPCRCTGMQPLASAEGTNRAADCRSDRRD